MCAFIYVDGGVHANVSLICRCGECSMSDRAGEGKGELKI